MPARCGTAGSSRERPAMAPARLLGGVFKRPQKFEPLPRACSYLPISLFKYPGESAREAEPLSHGTKRSAVPNSENSGIESAAIDLASSYQNRIVVEEGRASTTQLSLPSLATGYQQPMAVRVK